MPAYKLRITPPSCPCGMQAWYEVRTTRNEKVGDFCSACADETVAGLNGVSADARMVPKSPRWAR